MPDIIPIFTKNQSDKETFRKLGRFYNRVLPKFLGLGRRVRLLEIGVALGSSLRSWQEYFGGPERIALYAIDVDQWRIDNVSDIAVGFCGDQADEEFLRSVVAQSGGQWDIVIDDGGHWMRQQQVSFSVLYQEVKPEGLYVIEDLEYSIGKGIREVQRSSDMHETTLDMLFGIVKSSMQYKGRRVLQPMFTFCNEACAIEKQSEIDEHQWRRH